MGTIKQGILGGFSGKVGTVIGGNWKGIDYMRSKAASVSNPKTEAQLDQRARFGAALAFLQPITPFVRVGFKNYAVKMTAFNSAMSYNLNNALVGAYPDYAIDYNNALVSRGTLATALNALASSNDPNTVTFTWEDNSTQGNANATDQAMLLGNVIFSYVFRIELYAFRVTCGIVLVYSGWNALQKGVLINISKGMRIQDISSVPIAIPMIAGPGTITAAVTFPAQYGTLVTVLAIFAALGVNYVVMFYAKSIGRVLIKVNVMSALVRIIGLIIATIGVQMVFDGISTYIKMI